jgi:hypothetical protein
MNSYSLHRSPEKSARAKELANVNESQKSRAPAPPAEQTLDSFASWGASGNNTTESLYEMNFELQFQFQKKSLPEFQSCSQFSRESHTTRTAAKKRGGAAKRQTFCT